MPQVSFCTHPFRAPVPNARLQLLAVPMPKFGLWPLREGGGSKIYPVTFDFTAFSCFCMLYAPTLSPDSPLRIILPAYSEPRFPVFFCRGTCVLCKCRLRLSEVILPSPFDHRLSPPYINGGRLGETCLLKIIYSFGVFPGGLLCPAPGVGGVGLGGGGGGEGGGSPRLNPNLPTRRKKQNSLFPCPPPVRFKFLCSFSCRVPPGPQTMSSAGNSERRP